jgi:hypothetical protein
MNLDFFINHLKGIDYSDVTIIPINDENHIDIYIKTFLQQYSSLNEEIDLVSFLKENEDLSFKKGNILFSLMGLDMIDELNDINADNDILEFAVFNCESLGISFSIDTKSRLIYAFYGKYDTVNNKILSSNKVFFSNSFINFLDEIYKWISTNTTEEEILRAIELKDS